MRVGIGRNMRGWMRLSDDWNLALTDETVDGPTNEVVGPCWDCVQDRILDLVRWRQEKPVPEENQQFQPGRQTWKSERLA